MLPVVIGFVLIIAGIQAFTRRRPPMQGAPQGWPGNLTTLFSGPLAGALMVVAGLGFLSSTSFMLIDADKVGHLKRIYFAEDLPPGRIIALAGRVDAQTGAGAGEHGAEEAAGVGHGAGAEALQVGVVGLQAGDGTVDVVLGSRRRRGSPRASWPPRTQRTPPHGSSPSSSASARNTQRLAASRTASMTARPVTMWSAMLSRPGPKVLAVVQRHDHLGTDPADGRGDVGPQPQPVLEHPVGVAEDLEVGHADGVAGGVLLAGPQRRRLLRRHAVDAGLARGDQRVGDGLALVGPPGHRRRGAVLHVVGVGDDRQPHLPVLGHGLQRRRAVVGHPGIMAP